MTATLKDVLEVSAQRSGVNKPVGQLSSPLELNGTGPASPSPCGLSLHIKPQSQSEPLSQ